MAARADTAAANKQTVVGNAGGLDHRAQFERGHLIAAVVIHNVVQRIAVLGMHGCILRKATVIGQAGFFQVFALVEHAAAASIAFAAPVHGFYRYQVADF